MRRLVDMTVGRGIGRAFGLILPYLHTDFGRLVVAVAAPSKLREKLQMGIAWRLPHWLVYWAVIRAYSKATNIHSDKTPNELGFNDVTEAARVA